MLDKLIEMSEKINKNEWQQDILTLIHERIANILKKNPLIKTIFNSKPR